MENNKYYTPDIEDLKIGYECEFSPSSESKDNGKTWITHWKSITIDSSNLLYILGANVMSQVRTKYLTKEDIESEGWELFELKGFAYTGKQSFRFGFTKDNYILVLDTRKPHIEITAIDLLKIDWMPEFPENFKVCLPCKSINELRTIEKLLNI